MASLATKKEIIKEHIKQHYDITAVGISDAPRGFAAETYFVTTETETYFLKAMLNPGRQKLFMNGLKAQNELINQGIDFVPKVISTKEKQLYFQCEGAVLALYPRIIGKQSYEYDRKDVFEKLSRIYRASECFPQKGSFIKEDYNSWFIKAYQEEIYRFLDGEVEGSEAVEVKELLLPYSSFLKNCGKAAEDAVSNCENQEVPFYLTHSDFPGNVMICEDGQQYIIDFDEAVFGPIERDGWLTLVRENEESELWMSVMKKEFPEYQVNDSFIRFYVYQRFMIDLWDFIRQVLFNSDSAYRKRIVKSTREYLLGWLYPILLKYSE